MPASYKNYTKTKISRNIAFLISQIRKLPLPGNLVLVRFLGFFPAGSLSLKTHRLEIRLFEHHRREGSAVTHLHDISFRIFDVRARGIIEFESQAHSLVSFVIVFYLPLPAFLDFHYSFFDFPKVGGRCRLIFIRCSSSSH